jgi:uncharacterized membrane protein HdeD (DUF308 family)
VFLINAETRSRIWSLTLGTSLIVLGIVAITLPVFATAILIQLMGWLLIIAAVEQAIYAFKNREEGSIFWRVLLAVVYGIAACMLLLRPVSGAVTATVIIAILFLLDGVTEIGLGLRLRRQSRASGWLLAGGAMSLLFGGIILYQFPLSAMWTIGLLVGIRLVVKGIAQIMGAGPGSQPGADRRGDLKRAA